MNWRLHTVELLLSEAQSTRLPVIQIDVVIVLFQAELTFVPPATPKTAYHLQKSVITFHSSTAMNFNTINQRFVLFLFLLHCIFYFYFSSCTFHAQLS
jgi:hypothetical protein